MFGNDAGGSRYDCSMLVSVVWGAILVAVEFGYTLSVQFFRLSIRE